MKNKRAKTAIKVTILYLFSKHIVSVVYDDPAKSPTGNQKSKISNLMLENALYFYVENSVKSLLNVSCFYLAKPYSGFNDS